MTSGKKGQAEFDLPASGTSTLEEVLPGLPVGAVMSAGAGETVCISLSRPDDYTYSVRGRVGQSEDGSAWAALSFARVSSTEGADQLPTQSAREGLDVTSSSADANEVNSNWPRRRPPGGPLRSDERRYWRTKPLPTVTAPSAGGAASYELMGTLAEIERKAIEDRIAIFDGSIPKAADSLGVSPSTIYRKKENWD